MDGDEASWENAEMNYELYGILFHKGLSPHSGHYGKLPFCRVSLVAVLEIASVSLFLPFTGASYGRCQRVSCVCSGSYQGPAGAVVEV